MIARLNEGLKECPCMLDKVAFLNNFAFLDLVVQALDKSSIRIKVHFADLRIEQAVHNGLSKMDMVEVTPTGQIVVMLYNIGNQPSKSMCRTLLA